MLNRRNLLWLIPLGLLLTFPAWRLPITSFLEPRGGYDPDFSKRDKDVQNFVMEGVIIIQNQAGRRTAEVRAEQALTSELPNEFVLTMVNADIFDKADNKVNVLAETGIYNTDTRKLTLIDKVQVYHHANNQQLFSDLLHYFDDNRTINSPGPTRLIGKDIEIKGSSLDFDITTNQYKIGGRVYCTIEGFNQP